MKPETKENPSSKAPEKAKQISLLPASTPKAKFRVLPLATFKGQQLVGPEPTPAMIASVKAIGVFEPIVAFQPKEGRMKVGDGIRRIKAALEAEAASVPAMVYEEEEAFRHALSLIANAQRSPNPLAEVRAVMRLQKKGFSVQQIADSTGFPVQRINQRLRLNQLLTPLYNAMFAGKIAVSLGMEACKLPAPYQKKLVKIFTAKKKLKMLDLKGVKNCRQVDVLANLPEQIFAPVPKQNNEPRAESAAALNGIERELLALLIENWTGPKKLDSKRAYRIDALLSEREKAQGAEIVEGVEA